MRKGKKALDIIMALVILVFSLIVYGAIYGTRYDLRQPAESLQNFIMSETGYYLLTVLGALMVIYAVFIFLRALIAKTVLPAVNMKMDKGKVKITEESVEAVVDTSLRKYPQIGDVEKNVKMFGGNQPHIDVEVSCSTRQDQDLVALGTQIQNTLQRDVENFSGMTVENVNVNFVKPGDSSAIRM